MNGFLSWRTMIVCLMAISATVLSARASNGNAAFVFDGSVTNPEGETPKITVTVTWTQKGEVKTKSVVVDLARNDSDTDVRDKVANKLKTVEEIKNAFDITTDSNWGYQIVALKPKKGVFACGASILNGEMVDDEVTNKVKGMKVMSGGVDPITGDVIFDFFGTPTSGTVAIAVDGEVISVDTAGQSIEQIKGDLISDLQQLGFSASLDGDSQIVVTSVTVDNLFNLGNDGECVDDGLPCLNGGASAEVTDPGISEMVSAIQECQFVPIPTVSEWGLIVLTLLLLTTGTVVLVRRCRTAA